MCHKRYSVIQASLFRLPLGSAMQSLPPGPSPPPSLAHVPWALINRVGGASAGFRSVEDWKSSPEPLSADPLVSWRNEFLCAFPSTFKKRQKYANALFEKVTIADWGWESRTESWGPWKRNPFYLLTHFPPCYACLSPGFEGLCQWLQSTLQDALSVNH